MKRIVIIIHDAAHIIAWPIRMACNGLHAIMPHNKRVSHFILGVILMLCGSWLAHHMPSWCNTILWDAFSYGLHGLGAAPVVNVIAKILAMEV